MALLVMRVRFYRLLWEAHNCKMRTQGRGLAVKVLLGPIGVMAIDTICQQYYGAHISWYGHGVQP